MKFETQGGWISVLVSRYFFTTFDGHQKLKRFFFLYKGRRNGWHKKWEMAQRFERARSAAAPVGTIAASSSSSPFEAGERRSLKKKVTGPARDVELEGEREKKSKFGKKGGGPVEEKRNMQYHHRGPVVKEDDDNNNNHSAANLTVSGGSFRFANNRKLKSKVNG